jgi:undecaprenyl pyrophosphate phosphatase UppP
MDMNQAALWAGIILAALSTGSFGYAFGKDADNMLGLVWVALLELIAAGIFFCVAYP